MERDKRNIIPLDSINGIKIGSKILEYKSEFEVNSYSDNVKIKQGNSINTCCIFLTDESVEFDFNIYTQEIVSLRAKKGNVGKIIGTEVGIGITVKELLSHFKDSWDSDDFYLWNINFPGMYFGFMNDGVEFSFNKIKDYENNTINLIGMVAPNQKGNFVIYGMDWFENKDRLLDMWTKPVVS